MDFKRLKSTVTVTEKPNGVSHLPEGTQQYNGTATNYNRVTSFCRQKRVYLILLGILIMAIIVTVVILQPNSNSSGNNPKKSTTLFPPPTDPEPDTNMTLSGGRQIYTKKDWYGVEPRYERPLKHPTPFVVISHTATAACYSVVDCAAQMRSFQDYHMGSDLELPDIGYSFVVGGDGNVYEGRGWDATNMHTEFVKRCNIGISFIGNFVHDTPTKGQISAVQELIDLGVKLGKISEDYKLVAMNETSASLSPGVVVYGIIKTWPHFWKPTEDDVGVCPYKV